VGVATVSNRVNTYKSQQNATIFVVIGLLTGLAKYRLTVFTVKLLSSH